MPFLCSKTVWRYERQLANRGHPWHTLPLWPVQPALLVLVMNREGSLSNHTITIHNKLTGSTQWRPRGVYMELLWCCANTEPTAAFRLVIIKHWVTGWLTHLGRSSSAHCTFNCSCLHLFMITLDCIWDLFHVGRGFLLLCHTSIYFNYVFKVFTVQTEINFTRYQS